VDALLAREALTKGEVPTRSVPVDRARNPVPLDSPVDVLDGPLIQVADSWVRLPNAVLGMATTVFV
jgi:hypothetical protein